MISLQKFEVLVHLNIFTSPGLTIEQNKHMLRASREEELYRFFFSSDRLTMDHGANVAAEPGPMKRGPTMNKCFYFKLHIIGGVP